MNPDQLAALGQNAHAWARCYVTMKAALIKEGVAPDEAERVARDATNLAGMYGPEMGEMCPLCGRGE